MTPISRQLRFFWVRYVAPGVLEQDPGFRETMNGLTRRGLKVAGALGLAGVSIYFLAHLLAGRTFVWTYSEEATGPSVIMWNKVLIGLLSVGALALARFRPRVRPGRVLMAVFLVATALVLTLEDVSRGDFTFTAGWLTLVMLLTVGTVPFLPWQTGTLCVVIAAVYAYFASQPTALINSLDGGVPTSRLIYLGLVTFLCTTMSTSLYVSRYEQYRSLRRVGGLKERLSVRKEALQRALERGKRMQDQLVQKEKLASLGQLTAGIAHEIKNPLNFVNNFAQLSQELMDELAAELRSDPERSVGDVLEHVEDLLQSLRLNTDKVAEHGRRADNIVKSMLAHSRTSPGDRRPADINALVRDYASLAYHGMRARTTGFNVDLDLELDDAVGSIPIVKEEIGRVVLNLLENAFYAVQARRQEEGDAFAPRVRITTRSLLRGVSVAITDNGTGIPEALRERVFEPFFTTKASGEGTGLGLSLSYEIVAAGHGGSMEVDSTNGDGTTFTVTLPSTNVDEDQD